MSLSKSTLLAFLCALSVGVCELTTSRFCDSKTHLCFQQLQFATDDGEVTMGFSFPDPGSLEAAKSNDFIGRMSFPLPYGFAAFSMEHAPLPIQAVAFDPFAANINHPVNMSDFVIQPSQTLMNNSLAPFGNAITAISPHSTANESHADIIFRCENCMPASRSNSMFDPTMARINLVASISDVRPQYLNNVTWEAILPLDGAEEINFTLNLKDARFGNYTAMLKAGGFM